MSRTTEFEFRGVGIKETVDVAHEPEANQPGIVIWELSSGRGGSACLVRRYSPNEYGGFQRAIDDLQGFVSGVIESVISEKVCV